MNVEVVFVWKTVKAIFHFQKMEVVFNYQKKIDVVFPISPSWDKIRLHSENQFPRLPGTALVGFLTDKFKSYNKV
jgi:hypothetical protein